MTREQTKKYLKLIWGIAGRAAILFMPLISYFLFESVTGNLETISAPMAP